MTHRRIKTLATKIGSGKTPTGGSLGYIDEGVTFLRSQNIHFGGLRLDDVVYIDWATHREMRGTRVQSGDVLLNITGASLGRVTVAPPGLGEANVNQHVCIIRPAHDVDGRYLAWAISAKSVQDQILSSQVGGNRDGLNFEQVGNLEVFTPCIEEQRRIADFIDTETRRIEELLNSSRHQASLVTEKLTEAMRVATTVGLGGGRTTESGAPWMPAINQEWFLHKVSHHFLTGSGTTPSSNDSEYFNGPHPWVNSADLNNRVVRQTEKSVTDRALNDFSALKVHPAGTLIVALYGQGETKGRVGLLGIDACVNQACCALRPYGGVSAHYALYWFRAHKEGIVSLALGAGQPNLSQEQIRQLRIPAPDLDNQRRIVAALQKLETEIDTKQELLQARNALLTERRQALITAAVTGQIDVTTARGTGV